MNNRVGQFIGNIPQLPAVDLRDTKIFDGIITRVGAEEWTDTGPQTQKRIAELIEGLYKCYPWHKHSK